MVKKIVNIIFVLLFMAALAVVCLKTLVQPVQPVSEFENRALAAPPQVTAQAVFDGSCARQLEEFFSDHLAGRNQCLTAYTWLQMHAWQKPVVNDIVVTDRGLLPVLDTEVNEPEQAQIDARADAYRDFADLVESYGGRFLFVGVPSQKSVFAADYPDWQKASAEQYETLEKRFFAALEERGVVYLDVRALLSAQGEPETFYLQTDHHYRLETAERVYRSICDKLGVGAYSGQIEYETLGNPFYGSRGRVLFNLSDFEEKLDYFSLDGLPEFQRYDEGFPAESFLFAIPTDEDEPVNYTFYMGGDKGETWITTERAELPDLFLFGNSYTNAVECFSWLSFDEMRSVDMRYNTYQSLREYVGQLHPDYVVCIIEDSEYLTETGNGALD